MRKNDYFLPIVALVLAVIALIVNLQRAGIL